MKIRASSSLVRCTIISGSTYVLPLIFIIQAMQLTRLKVWRERLLPVADERSSRKSYNREFEAVHLCTTLNDHVVLGVKKTVRWTFFREGLDASFLSYLCLISEVCTLLRCIIVRCTIKKSNTLVLSFFILPATHPTRYNYYTNKLGLFNFVCG